MPEVIAQVSQIDLPIHHVSGGMTQPVRRRLPQSFGCPLGGLTREREMRDCILKYLLDDQEHPTARHRLVHAADGKQRGRRLLRIRQRSESVRLEADECKREYAMYLAPKAKGLWSMRCERGGIYSTSDD